MGKDSFIMYDSMLETLAEIGEHDAYEFIVAIKKYRSGVEVKFDQPLKQALWITFKGQFDRDNERYEKTCKARQESGRLGGRPRKANGFSENQKKAKKANGFSENQKKAKKADTDTVSDTVSDIKEKNILDIPKEKPSANATASSFAKQKGFKSWNELDFRKNVDDAVKEDPNLGTFSNEFCEYWTEKTSSGKMRFQTEKTWETPKRLVRWKNNSFSKCLDDSKDAGLSSLPTAEQLLATEGNYD